MASTNALDEAKLVLERIIIGREVIIQERPGARARWRETPEPAAPFTVEEFGFDEEYRTDFNNPDAGDELRCWVRVLDASGWKVTMERRASFAELLREALHAELVGLVLEG